METKEEKQLKLDKRYIRMASIWAENSYCERRQVGALIVKDKMIISDGYNGTPAGFENVCEDDNGVTKPYVLHAEANAITKISFRFGCRGKCHHQSRSQQQQQRRSNHVRHRISLHRMCQTHHPSRNQTCGLLRKIPFGRRA